MSTKRDWYLYLLTPSLLKNLPNYVENWTFWDPWYLLHFVTISSFYLDYRVGYLISWSIKSFRTIRFRLFDWLHTVPQICHFFRSVWRESYTLSFVHLKNSYSSKLVVLNIKSLVNPLRLRKTRVYSVKNFDWSKIRCFIRVAYGFLTIPYMV